MTEVLKAIKAKLEADATVMADLADRPNGDDAEVLADRPDPDQACPFVIIYDLGSGDEVVRDTKARTREPVDVQVSVFDTDDEAAGARAKTIESLLTKGPVPAVEGGSVCWVRRVGRARLTDPEPDAHGLPVYHHAYTYEVAYRREL